DAVRCALDVQNSLRARNAGLPQDRRIEFRIGVNLGDVIVTPDDIYGHGVNVAARLERLAPPGGKCISADVRRHHPRDRPRRVCRPRRAQTEEYRRPGACLYCRSGGVILDLIKSHLLIVIATSAARAPSWLFSQGTANNSQETAMFSAVIRRALPL